MSKNVKLVSLPQQYRKKIKEVAETLGISQSELIRRAVDEYLMKIGFWQGGGGD